MKFFFFKLLKSKGPIVEEYKMSVVQFIQLRDAYNCHGYYVNRIKNNTESLIYFNEEDRLNKTFESTQNYVFH